MSRTVGCAALSAAVLFATATGWTANAAPAPAGPRLIPAEAPQIRKAIESAGGAAVLVNIWATWCVPCREEFADVLKVRRDLAGRGLKVILVSADFDDARDDALRFLGERGVDFPSYVKVGRDEDFIAALAIGSAIPMADQKMMNVDGKEIAVADVRGAKGTLVVFTCNACPWAKAWEDRIVALGNEFQKKGVGVIAVNANDPGKVAEDGYDQMKARAMEKGFGFPYVVDSTSKVARAYGASRTPEAFLFDASGKLVYHGTIDDNAQEPGKVTTRYLKDALTAVSNGQDVAVKEAKALGCGIKFRA